MVSSYDEFVKEARDRVRILARTSPTLSPDDFSMRVIVSGDPQFLTRYELWQRTNTDPVRLIPTEGVTDAVTDRDEFLEEISETARMMREEERGGEERDLIEELEDRIEDAERPAATFDCETFGDELNELIFFIHDKADQIARSDRNRVAQSMLDFEQDHPIPEAVEECTMDGLPEFDRDMVRIRQAIGARNANVLSAASDGLLGRVGTWFR